VAVFTFPAETRFYSRCLSDLAFPRASTVAELGSGDGTAVIAALRDHPDVTVSGIERDPVSAQAAKQAIASAGITGYHVACGDFMLHRPPGRMLVANPPYMPSCPDAPEDVAPMLAQCDGGPTGGEASIALLGLGYEDVMLLVAGHADPMAVLSAARGAGYEVAGWLARPFGFGALHPPVMKVLRGLAATGQAFFTESSYVLAGVLWKQGGRVGDAERSLAACLTLGHKALDV